MEILNKYKKCPECCMYKLETDHRNSDEENHIRQCSNCGVIIRYCQDK